jgi:hypothetical protein
MKRKTRKINSGFFVVYRCLAKDFVEEIFKAPPDGERFIDFKISAVLTFGFKTFEASKF